MTRTGPQGRTQPPQTDPIRALLASPPDLPVVEILPELRERLSPPPTPADHARASPGRTPPPRPRPRPTQASPPPPAPPPRRPRPGGIVVPAHPIGTSRVRAPPGLDIRCRRGHSTRPGACPSGRGRFRAAGGIRRRRGPDSCPPTRRVPPTGRECTPARRVSPSRSAAQSSCRSSADQCQASAGPAQISARPAPARSLPNARPSTGPASIQRSGRCSQYQDALGESAHQR